jgi:hypothetical protein
MTDRKFTVINRSASIVHYSVPELGIKSRDFQPGESKQIGYAELQGLSYMPGGRELIRDYLLIKDESAKNDLVGTTEPEYNMTSAEVVQLIQHGTLDEWLDALDFAPEGVIDLIKTLSVELPLTDTRKMDAFKEKKGIDLGRMIQVKKEVAAEEEQEEAAQKPAPQRRTQKATTSTNPARRTTGQKYKVISQG